MSGSWKGRSPVHVLTPQQQVFVRAIADGVEPIEACKKAWPACEKNKRDIDVRLATVMENQKILTAIHWLTKWKVNEDLLTAGIAAVLRDEKSKPAQKISALKLLGTLGGSLKPEVEKLAKRKKVAKLKGQETPDEEFHEKLKDLRAKAARPN